MIFKTNPIFNTTHKYREQLYFFDRGHNDRDILSGSLIVNGELSGVGNIGHIQLKSICWFEVLHTSHHLCMLSLGKEQCYVVCVCVCVCVRACVNYTHLSDVWRCRW